jgi:hypothetical protein
MRILFCLDWMFLALLASSSACMLSLLTVHNYLLGSMQRGHAPFSCRSETVFLTTDSCSERLTCKTFKANVVIHATNTPAYGMWKRTRTYNTGSQWQIDSKTFLWLSCDAHNMHGNKHEHHFHKLCSSVICFQKADSMWQVETQRPTRLNSSLTDLSGTIIWAFWLKKCSLDAAESL